LADGDAVAAVAAAPRATLTTARRRGNVAAADARAVAAVRSREVEEARAAAAAARVAARAERWEARQAAAAAAAAVVTVAHDQQATGADAGADASGADGGDADGGVRRRRAAAAADAAAVDGQNAAEAAAATTERHATQTSFFRPRRGRRWLPSANVDARAKGTQAAAWPTPYAGALDGGTDVATAAAATEGSPLTLPAIGDAAADAAAVADAGGRKRPPLPHGDITTRPPGPG